MIPISPLDHGNVSFKLVADSDKMWEEPPFCNKEFMLPEQHDVIVYSTWNKKKVTVTGENVTSVLDMHCLNVS